jgi:hypothetical protein
MPEESDDLVLKLGRHVRAEPDPAGADDPVWERLASGELTAAEDAELRQRAAADPGVAALYEAYRPLEASTKERIARNALEQLQPAPQRAVWWRRAAMVAAPTAAAAAVAIVLMRAAAPSGPGAAVPAYALVVTGGDRATRSGGALPDSTPIELHRGSRLEIVLRPSTPAAGPVVVNAFLVRGSEARAWTLPMERSTDGAVRITGEAGALLAVPAGTWDLTFVVGREGAVTADPSEVARAARSGAGAHEWQLLQRRVELVDAP